MISCLRRQWSTNSYCGSQRLHLRRMRMILSRIRLRYNLVPWVEQMYALRLRFLFGCIRFRVGCTLVQIVIFVIYLYVTLTLRHLWVVITFYFHVTRYYGTFNIMYEDYVVSPFYLIILLQGSYLFEGCDYYKPVMTFFFIMLNFKK